MQIVLYTVMYEFERKCWRQVILLLDGAYSPHTLRGYYTDLRIFEAWCDSNHRQMVPADSETVIDFIGDQAQSICPNSIRRRLVAIKRLHALYGQSDPTTSEWVRLAMRRAKRQKPMRPKQAHALTASLRDRLITSCPNTMIGFRNQAMIALGYDTLCRRSELVALRVEDIVPIPTGGAMVLVRRAKNDPFGRGRYASLSIKGLSIVRKWTDAADLVKGPLMRIVYQQKAGRRSIGPDQVGRILKEVARNAGVESAIERGLSGHSMRVGAAQDLMVQGRNILQIMHAGGWKSINIVSRYCEGADLNVWER